MLFPMYLWGFSPRIHPSDIPASLIRRLLDDCPNIVAIKAEGGFPSIMGVIECHRLFGDEVVISCPIEGEFIPLAQVMPLHLTATSDHEYYGPMIPRIFRHLEAGEHDAATALYWQIHPARKAKQAVAMQLHGGAFINRQAWKFQAWLQGYNGGPLAPADATDPRQPDEHAPQGPRRLRPRADDRPQPRILRRQEPDVTWIK